MASRPDTEEDSDLDEVPSEQLSSAVAAEVLVNVTHCNDIKVVNC